MAVQIRRTDRLVWVSLPYATFGLVVRDELIVAAPPIAQWTIGKSEMDVARYYRRRRARFVVTF